MGQVKDRMIKKLVAEFKKQLNIDIENIVLHAAKGVYRSRVLDTARFSGWADRVGGGAINILSWETMTYCLKHDFDIAAGSDYEIDRKYIKIKT